MAKIQTDRSCGKPWLIRTLFFIVPAVLGLGLLHAVSFTMAQADPAGDPVPLVVGDTANPAVQVSLSPPYTSRPAGGGVRALLASSNWSASTDVGLNTEAEWFDNALDTTYSIAWGDVDGDGDLDLAVGNVVSEGHKVYLNVDDALQTPATWVSCDTRHLTDVELAWGDVDGDGDLDLAVGHGQDLDTSVGVTNVVYLNVDGSLQCTPAWTDEITDVTYSLAWGDVNGDGYLDLAVGNGLPHPGPAPCAPGGGSSNKLYLNVNGTLSTAVAWTDNITDNTHSLAWGDVDNDGDLDLAIGNGAPDPNCSSGEGGPNKLYLNVNGTLSTTTAWTDNLTDDTRSVAWGDVDGDGDLDLAVGNVGAPNKLYLNREGTLSPTPDWVSGDSEETRSVAWGDVDGDGDLDLAVGNVGAPNKLYLNENSDLQTLAAWHSSGMANTYSVAWGDVDGDGDLDLAAGDLEAPNRIYFNDGELLSLSWRSDQDDETWSVAWGDVDRDGDLDLAAGISGTAKLYLNENGVLSTPAAWTSNDGGDTRSVAWGDVDGDGDLDLAAGISGTNKLYLNENGVLSTTVAWASGDSTQTRSVAWGDVDGDGDLDLAAGNEGEGNKLYLNESGILSTIAAWTSDDSDVTASVAWGDVDGDGDLDLAAGNGSGSNKVYLNQGGVLQTDAGWVSSGSDNTWSVAWGDVDGDGDLDLAIGNALGPNKVHLNQDGALQAQPDWISTDSEDTHSLAWGDVDGDGDLDLVAGSAEGTSSVYLNREGDLETDATWTFSHGRTVESVAWGDVDSDGDLDLAVGARDGGPIELYVNQRPSHPLYVGHSAALSLGLDSDPVQTFNQTTTPLAPADFYAVPGVRESGIIPITYTLFNPGGEPFGSVQAFYSPDGGGRWYTATAASTQTRPLSTGLGRTYSNESVQTIPLAGTINVPLVITDAAVSLAEIADVDVRVSIVHSDSAELAVALRSPAGTQVELFSGRGSGNSLERTWFSDQAATPIVSATAPFTGTYRPEGVLASFSGQTISGTWTLIITDAVPPPPPPPPPVPGSLLGWGVRLRTSSPEHTYTWDVLGSGFFGQSDNVVLRLEAYPQPAHAGITGTCGYTNSVPGPFQHPFVSAQTFPFRVRGTQVRVLSGTVPVEDAIVYRLPEGQSADGEPIATETGAPFRTNSRGYLDGRGEIQVGDQLVALLPVSATETYTVYYTSASPTLTGLEAYTVTTVGVQELAISPTDPLILFNLDVSLEWDAHKDTAYLEQLEYNLQRASEYLYDFTDGQVALGNVNISQNADGWAYSHVIIRTNDRLRPFATQGGVVTTNTLDVQHNTPTYTIEYNPGQVVMGSTWNRYGRPGQSLGDDWAIILAHELSHYLLFHDDTYLGLDQNGYLVAVDTCRGSAMGDLYGDLDNTEFIADESTWQANCKETLPEQTLGRNEWETMALWYPWLVTPAITNAGPSLMPFDFATVHIHDPHTPTNTLEDPTFYIDYEGGGGASSEARAYLLRDEADPSSGSGPYVIDLGSPFGGQNRVIAWGVQPDDRLCVFDRPRAQFGCETIEHGDDRLTMREDSTWSPIIQLSPINSTTIIINVSSTLPITPLQARIFPDLGYAEEPITLTLPGGDGAYSGTLTLSYAATSGHIQVWVNETATESSPRRETIIAYSVGGNPGMLRGSGGMFRGSGGMFAGGGGVFRGGGMSRGSGAPIVSPDGQTIVFTENPIDFITGTFFTVQTMAGVPDLPPGRTLIGQAYNLVASPGATLPVTSSVSIQYLSNDVLTAGASESDLTIYFWNGSEWIALDTVLDTYFDLASAPSQGEGVYTLMASAKIPLYGPGWNLFAYPVHATQAVSQALLSISGYYSTVYGYEPEDMTDPWKVYDTGVPTYVNDLDVLEYGKGYWISVTQAITLHLSSSASANLQSEIHSLNSEMPLPPATYYGEVVGRGGFAPAAGMPVMAWTDSQDGSSEQAHLCGQAQTVKMGGQVVYAINVLAQDVVGAPGCGMPGRQVKFQVGTQMMGPTVVWSNNRVRKVALTPDESYSIPRIYLPVVTRH